MQVTLHGAISASKKTPHNISFYAMAKPDHKNLNLWIVEDNDEMRATLVEVIDSDAEMMCSLSFVNGQNS